MPPPRRVQLPNVKIDARGTLATYSQAGNLNGHPRVGALKLGVFHGTVSQDAAGVRDLAGVVGYWQTAGAGGSAHGIVDNEGLSAYTVDISHKAPHCGGMNGVSVGLELISNVPGWLRPTYWRFRPRQLHELARWVAYLNMAESLPIQPAHITSTGIVTVAGWTTHRVLGQLHLGTDHTDPGPYFPAQKVLGMAKWYRQNGWVNGEFNVKPTI